MIPNLDSLVPFESTKPYDILDVIYPVSTTATSIIPAPALMFMVKTVSYTLSIFCSAEIGVAVGL